MSIRCEFCGQRIINGNYVCGHTPAPDEVQRKEADVTFDVHRVRCDECDDEKEDFDKEWIALHVDHLAALRMLCTIPGNKNCQPFWLSWDFFRTDGIPEAIPN